MKLSILLFPLVAFTSVLTGSTVALAQTYQPSNRIPVADGTLGTQVLGGNGNFGVVGGVSRGQNVFHSFQDFSVPTNGSVTFVNPVGNQSIITRVTGGMFSDINGLVNTQGANFLLINPNGVVFGPGVQLNVGRLFLTSTASSIDLVDGGGRTVTFGTNPLADAPFLTINPNIFFNVSRLNLGGGGEIRNFGVLQTGNANQYIGLIGGNVSISGGQINALGGRVELGGLSAPGSVELGVDGNSPRVSIPQDVDRSNVLLTNRAVVDVTGNGGSDIAINARTIQLFGESSLKGGIFPGLGTPITVAGDIKLKATERVFIDSGSSIINAVRQNSTGKGGNVGIEANNVLVQNGSSLSASTFGLGSAGNVTVLANQNVSILGASIFSTVEPGGAGNAGSINVNADSLSLQNANLQTLTRGLVGFGNGVGNGNAGNVNLKINGATDISGGEVNSSIGSGASGNGGNIIVNTGSLFLQNGAQLNSSTFGSGNAGNVAVTAKNSVSFDNANILSGVPGGVGKGGGIAIETGGSLSLQNGSTLQSRTLLGGQGNAGNISVKVAGLFDIAGTNNGSVGGINSEVGAGTIGNAGSVSVEAGSLSLKDGSFISSSTAGQGNAKDVALAVKGSISLASGASVRSRVDGGVGNAGNISINSSSLSLKDSASLTSSTFGRGDAGNVTLNVKDNISLVNGINNDGTLISSEVRAGGVGKGGNIEINSSSLLLQDGAQIRAAVREADISTGAPAGRGAAGNVNIKVTGDVDLFGVGSRFSGIGSSLGAGATGSGGNIIVNAGSLSLKDNAFLTASTVGTGNAGSVDVTAKDSISLDRANFSSTVQQGAVGNSGGIRVNASSLLLQNNAELSSSTFGKGNAGSVDTTIEKTISLDNAGLSSIIGQSGIGNGGGIKVEAGSLLLQNGAQLNSSTFGRGNAGNVAVNAKDTITFVGSTTGGDTVVSSEVRPGGVGKGGNIEINSNSLSLQNGAQIRAAVREADISTGAPAGRGAAGNVNIKVTGDVDLFGVGSRFSGIGSSLGAGATGSGGNIIVNAGSLSLKDNAFLTASTVGTGNAGSVDVTAKDSISLDRANFSSTVQQGAVGNSGGIRVNASSLLLQNNAELSSSTFGKGNAGSVDTTIEKTISLDNAGLSSIIGQSGIGNGGGIKVEAGSLLLQNGAQLNSSTFGRGNAGNVAVNAKDTITLVGSTTGGDTVVSSEVRSGGVGKGGNIEINSNSLSLQNGAQIRAATRGATPPTDKSAGIPAGKGDAGNVNVRVAGAVDLSGVGTNPSAIGSSVELGTEGNAGNITIDAGSLSLRDDAFLRASTSGQGNAGNVTVTAKDSVLLVNGSSADGTFISSEIRAGGIGKGGNVNINAGSLILKNGANLLAATREAIPPTLTAAGTPAGRGDAGNVNVQVTGAVDLSGIGVQNSPSFIASDIRVRAEGHGGNTSINAGSLSLRDRAFLSAFTGGKGNAGNVFLTTKEAVSLDNAQIFSSTAFGSVGKGGDVTIDADSLSLKNTSIITSATSGQGNAGNVTLTTKNNTSLESNSGIASEVLAGGVGKGGNIDISSNSLSLKDGAQIRAATREATPPTDIVTGAPAGKGDAGNVNVRVVGAVDLSGIGNNQSSAIGSSVEQGTEGHAGSITVNAGALSLKDGAFITASTTGQGNAGTVTVNAKDSLLISGKNGGLRSKLSVRSDSDTGIAGDINVASPKIALDDSGTIESGSNSGNGGNINISGRVSSLPSLSNTNNSTVDSTLVLRRGAQISASSSGVSQEGNTGGNVNINSNFVIAIPSENSDIIANAVGGRGGNVNINSQLFGIQNRPKPTTSSDITASSEFGQSGNINLNTLGIDPGKDTGELPVAPIDASKQIAQACGADQLNKFYITGRGGHPPNTDEQLSTEAVWSDPRNTKPQLANNSGTPLLNKLLEPAVAMVFDGKGNATLIANNSEAETGRIKIACPVSHKLPAGGTR
jgi:filamentous hemagglutinin family protein